MKDRVNPICAYKRCSQPIKIRDDRAITKQGNFHLNCWFSWRVDTFYNGSKK